MAIKVFAVRVGNRYGEEYENYLKSKLENIEFLNSPSPDFIWQWNKLHFMNRTDDEPICVIDIDIELINDYTEIFNYPIERGEFLTLNPWWNNSNINGAFYKFYPKDTHYIYDEFVKNQDYWKRYFIENGEKPGPVNGEENFVYEMVNQRLKIKYLPQEWYGRYHKDELLQLNLKYPKEYFKLGEFNSHLKLLHYNGYQ